MLKPTLFYRAASILSVLFAAGHFYGFLRFKPPTVQAIALRAAMDTTRFVVGHHSYSFGDFYLGAGVYAGTTIVLIAALALWLGEQVRKDPASVAVPTVFLLLFELSSIAICWTFFSSAPLIFSALIALCLAFALWCARRQVRGD